MATQHTLEANFVVEASALKDAEAARAQRIDARAIELLAIAGGIDKQLATTIYRAFPGVIVQALKEVG